MKFGKEFFGFEKVIREAEVGGVLFPVPVE